jgi:polysaccharide export outer membrane protein
MAGNITKNNLIGFAYRAGALLLPIALLLPVTTLALEMGGAADPCASSADPRACYKNLANGQQPVSGSQQLKGTDAGSAVNPPAPHTAASHKKNDQPPEHSEFQTFVATSIGKTLPSFGYDLFGDVPDTFAPIDNIPVTPDYMIGPGDELVIKGWGQVDIDVRAVVNRNGAINLPKVGTINVAGIRYQELQSYLKNAIGRVFRNFELNVSLGKLRAIQVFVLGQAKRPGVYTVSSLSTLVNTLFASGGPSLTGSLRHIQVKRNGAVVTELDMYDLLLKGDKTKDVALLPGDVVYIPPVGQLVAIYGGINNAAIYELKDDKTSLADLMALAGGLTTTAAGQKVLLERIEGRKVRQVEELQLDKNGLAHLVKDGDLVQVFSIDARFDNAVTLRGNVATPGRYPWKEGMRVKDLIPDRNTLIVPEYWLRQNRTAQIKTAGADRLKTEGKYGTADMQTGVKNGTDELQTGAKNGTDELQTGAKNGTDELQNEVKHGTAEINWNYAIVERLNKDDLTTQLLPFNLGKAIDGQDSDQNLLLQTGDTVTIFSKDDIQVPLASRSVYVRLEGEVANAGVYKALPGETLRQVLVRVGGLTPDAYLYGAEFDRESVREMQQEKLKRMIDKMEEAVQRNLSSKAQTALSPEDVASSKAQAVAQAALIERMRKTRATGRVVLEISPDNSGQIKELPDLALQDGDRFMVPAKPAVVSVMGMVYNENAFLYRSGKHVGDYLNQAGGTTRDADDARMYLLRADGSVLSAQNSDSIFSSFTDKSLQPGDTVIVPENMDKFSFTKTVKDLSQIFFQFAMGAAGLKVLGF